MVVNSSVGTSETPAPLACNQQSQTPKTKVNPQAPKIWRISKDAWLRKKERAIELKHAMAIIPPGRLLTSKERLNGSFSCLFYRLPVFKYHLNLKTMFNWQTLSKAKMFSYS